MENFSVLARKAARGLAPLAALMTLGVGAVRVSADPAPGIQAAGVQLASTTTRGQTVAAPSAKFSNTDYTSKVDPNDPATFALERRIFGDLVSSDLRGLKTGTSIPDYSFIDQPGTYPQVADDFAQWPGLTASIAMATRPVRGDILRQAQRNECDAEGDIAINADYRDVVERDLFTSDLWNLDNQLRVATFNIGRPNGKIDTCTALECITSTVEDLSSTAKSKGTTIIDELRWKVAHKYIAPDDWRKNVVGSLVTAIDARKLSMLPGQQQQVAAVPVP